MIWGMVLQPGDTQTEVVDSEVHLSMASLECRPMIAPEKDVRAHVILKTTLGEYLLCSLGYGPTPQQNLDLILQPQEEITFSVEGTGTVYLTGYTRPCTDTPSHDGWQFPEEEEEYALNSDPGMKAEFVEEDVDISEDGDVIVAKIETEDNTLVDFDPWTAAPISESIHPNVCPTMKKCISCSNLLPLDNNSTSLGTTPSLHCGSCLHQITSRRTDKLSSPTLQTLSHLDLIPSQVENSSITEPGMLSAARHGTERTLSEHNVLLRQTGSARHLSVECQMSSSPSHSIRPQGVSSTLPQHIQSQDSHQNSESPGTMHHSGTNSQSVPPHTLLPIGSTKASPSSFSSNSREFPSRSQSSRAHQQANGYSHNQSSSEGTYQHSTIIPHLIPEHPLNLPPGETSGSASGSSPGIHVSRADVNSLTNHGPRENSIAVASLPNLRKNAHSGPSSVRQGTRRKKPADRGRVVVFKCDYCPKTFQSISNRRIHERVHTGEKPYHCQYCPKSFTQSTNLKSHEKTHTGERPHKCTTCDKTFIRTDALKNHLKTHTKERPYTCRYCLQEFAQSKTMKLHEQSHIKP